MGPAGGTSASASTGPLRTVLAAAVALATAAALSVALAPAASAFQEPRAAGFSGNSVDLTDIVRLAPDAQGKQTAPQLTPGAKGQQAPDMQIKLPVKSEATKSAAGKIYATWQPGDVLVVTLPKGVTFAKAPTVTASNLVEVATGAAFGTPVSATITTDTGADVTLEKPQTAVTLSSDASAARILIKSALWGGVPEPAQGSEWLNVASADFGSADQPGFVLDITGISLNVGAAAVGTVTAQVSGEASNGFYGSADYATYPAQAPAACTVGTAGGTRLTSYVGGTTTLGFLPSKAIAVTQPSGQVVNATLDLQQLPPITVSGGFASGVADQLTADVVVGGATAGSVLFDFPSHNPQIGYMDAVIATSGSVQGVSLAPSAGQYSTTRTAALSLTAQQGGNGAVTISGLRVAGYVPTGQSGARAIPAGSSIAVSAKGGAAAVNDAATVGCLTKPGASAFSAVLQPSDVFAAEAPLAVAKSSSRIGGLNRYDTAARLALDYVATPGVSRPEAVVIANGENKKGGFDALSANFLAGQVGAPILLTQATTLPRESAQALRAVLDGSPKATLYVMGKADSVSDAVVTQATAIAKEAVSGEVTVQRVAGNNRYATSALAAGIGSVGSLSFAKGSPSYKTAILASGVVSADALAAGPLSFSAGLPVLLTGPGALPAEVTAFVKKAGVQQVFVLGGLDRVSADALAQLRSLGVAVVKRIAGPNRFATSAELYSFALAPASTEASDGGGLGWGSSSKAFVANGLTGFPDALAAGPAAGAAKSVLVTASPTRRDPAVAELTKKSTTVVGLGQPATVPDAFVK
jgi:putative cell wall-binding protein